MPYVYISMCPSAFIITYSLSRFLPADDAIDAIDIDWNFKVLRLTFFRCRTYETLFLFVGYIIYLFLQYGNILLNLIMYEIRCKRINLKLSVLSCSFCEFLFFFDSFGFLKLPV